MSILRNKYSEKRGIAVSLIFIVIGGFLFFYISNSPVSGTETSLQSISAVSTNVQFYVYIEGDSQGIIQGCVSNPPSGAGTIQGYQYSHSLYNPTTQQGQITGMRVHSPVVIVKEVDNSTPNLYQALVTAENLRDVIIRFYRNSTGGQLQNYYTVHLESATIISIREFMPNSLNPATYQPIMDEVAFIYRKITWIWEDTGVEFTDNWDIQGA